MFASILLLAALPTAFANLYVTQPVATTVWPVGTTVTLQWQDDGATPNLAALGVCDVGIFAGNVNQQTLLQQIGTFDVSTQASMDFTIHADIGPSNVANYFIRVTSQNLKDAANNIYPAQAFSAMFAVSGATGTFNSTVQAQIAGVSSAALPSASVAAPSAGSVVASSAAHSASASASAAKASTTAKTNSTTAASNSNGASTGTSVSMAGMFTAALLFGAAFLL